MTIPNPFKDLEFFHTGRLTGDNRPIDATEIPTKAHLIAGGVAAKPIKHFSCLSILL